MSSSLERRVAALEKQTGTGRIICLQLHPDLAENERRLAVARASCGPFVSIIAYGWKRPHPRYDEK
ncbi:MAG TPA: hypothetical protein VIH18_20320 [Candidatus Binatia bacterium]|jgi:hypothetical protein